MPRRARTHHAILGLLSWKPMSGYDIRKLVEVALKYFWSESYGQIFPTLNGLVAKGLAVRRVDPASRGRRRQIYRVTAAGRRAHQDWMKQPAEEPRLRDESKLKFFLSSKGAPGESLRLLREYGEQQRRHLAMLKESEAIFEAALGGNETPEELRELGTCLGWGDRPDLRRRSNEIVILYLTLRSGILVAEARVAWVEEATSLVEGRAARRRGSQCPQRGIKPRRRGESGPRHDRRVR